MSDMSIIWTEQNRNFLENEAKETGMSISDIANKAIEFFFGRQEEYDEDAEDIAAAEKAWNDFIASGKQAIPAEEVYRKLGI